MSKATFKVGETVWWRGGFGSDPARQAKIESIELCETPHEKYGVDVNEAYVTDKDRITVSLDNGHWAYGTQISKIN